MCVKMVMASFGKLCVGLPKENTKVEEEIKSVSRGLKFMIADLQLVKPFSLCDTKKNL